MRRKVQSATWYEARSILQSWRPPGRHWRLVLECGHVETRPMRYAGVAHWGSQFALEQAKPAPKWVICHTCAKEAQS